jgi:HK97 family phage portal protein
VAILSRAVKNARAMMRSAEWGDSSIPPNSAMGFDSSAAGGGIESVALSVGTVLACVKALHDDVKTLNFEAFTGDPKGAHQPLAVQPRIVAEPFGPDLDVHAGMGQIVTSYAMRGNAYAFVVSTDPKTGLPDQLSILHPDSVHPKRKNGRKVFRIGSEDYGTDEVVHITGLMAAGAVAGLDVLTAQRVNFDLAMKVSQYADSFFGNGGSPSGVITAKGPGNRTKAREVREAWEDSHSGVFNAHRPAVLFGGATWTPLSVTPENAQFLETRRFMREELCGIFGVPLQRIQAIVENASQGGGAGLDAIDAGYVKHGLLPIGVTIESAWKRLIPGGDRTWTNFDFDTFLRANAKVRAEIRQINRVTAIRTIDEERAAEGWEPLPDGQGQNPFSPLNSNASPTGGADNAPTPGGQGGTS